MAFAVLLVAGEAQKPAPILIPVARTERTVEPARWETSERRRAFFRTEWIEGYRAHGVHDPAWDGLVEEYLAKCARDWGEHHFNWRASRPDRTSAGKAVVAAGCTDPLVWFLVGTDHYGGSEHDVRTCTAIWEGLRQVPLGLIKQGYGGYARFLAARYYVFTPHAHLGEKLRLALQPDELQASLDWLRSPGVAAFPEIITESFMKEKAAAQEDPASYRALAEALARTPEDWPADTRWMLALVNGIAHTYLSGAHTLQAGALPALLDPAARQRVDHDEVRQAMRCLEEARRLNPADGQALYWQLVLATIDPGVADAPALVGAALSLNAGDVLIVEGFYRWLQVHRPDDLAAIRELSKACVRTGSFRTDVFEYRTRVLWWYMTDHPDRADELLADADLQCSLAEADFSIRGNTWPVNPDDIAWHRADYAALLFRMRQHAEAREAAAGVSDDTLGRLLEQRTTPSLRGRYLVEDRTDLDPAIKARMHVSLADFRSVIAADPVVRLFDEAYKTVAVDKEKGLAQLAEAAASGQGVIADSYAYMLAHYGRKAEALALIDRTIQRCGRRDRDAWAMFRLLALPCSLADEELAFARIEGHLDQLTSPRCVDEIPRIRTVALHDRFLALLQPWLFGRNNSFDLNVAELLLDTGEGAARAAEIFKDKRDKKGVNPRFLAWATTRQLLAARLSGSDDLEPPDTVLRALIGQKHSFATADIALAYLAGDIDRATAIQRAPAVGPDADELYFVLAVDALAHGDDRLARSDLDHLSVHPTWLEAGAAKRLRLWMDSRPPRQPAAARTTSADF